MQKGKVLAVNASPQRGTEKQNIKEGYILKGWGLENDAHGGDWDRQISIFPIEALEKVPEAKKAEVLQGGYTENITISGINTDLLAIGKTIQIGQAQVEILYIGKEIPKEHDRPYIVSREGRFGKVVKSGKVKTGDDVFLLP